MSQENVEIVRAACEAVQRGDWDAAMNIYAPDVELDVTRMPGGGVYEGREQVLGFYTRWFGAWDDPRWDFERIIDLGDSRVLVILRMTGRGRATGAEVSMRTADLHIFRDRKVIRHVGYPDADEALKAVGLEE